MSTMDTVSGSDPVFNITRRRTGCQVVQLTNRLTIHVLF